MWDAGLEFLARGWYGPPGWGSLLYLLVMTQLTIVSVTLYLHRSATHRAVDFHPILEHFFRFWVWLTTAMVTREWVAVHRKHHARVETDEDPHSPAVHGIAKVVWHGVVLYQRARADRALVEQYGGGTPNDAIERHLYTRAPWLGPTLLALVSIAAFGVGGMALWAVQMLWIPIFAAGVVNGLGHWWGYRNFETDDRSTNLCPLGIWIGGEELHNNHHAFPSSARFSMRRFELDLGWWLIVVLARLGLARVHRVAPRLLCRGPVAEADSDTLRALLSHRFLVLKQYFRDVLWPEVRAEAAGARRSLGTLGKRLRWALASDGRWLDEAQRARLGEWLATRPELATLVEYRRRLAALLDRPGMSPEALLEALRAWCAEAERSGIARLAAFAESLRGWRLATT